MDFENDFAGTPMGRPSDVFDAPDEPGMPAFKPRTVPPEAVVKAPTPAPETVVQAPPPTSKHEAALRQAFEAVGPHAGVKTFWAELKRVLPGQQESIDVRNDALNDPEATSVPESLIPWKQAMEYYYRRGGLNSRASIAERQAKLPADKARFLKEVFYDRFRAGLGMQALWHAIEDTKKQRNFMAKNGGARFISFEDMRAWYLQQEITQLMRYAPSLTKTMVTVPSAATLQPLLRMQGDTVVMKGAKSGQYTGIVHFIDVYSQFTWAIPVITVGKASNTAAAFRAVLKQIEKRYGKPTGGWNINLQTDNGGEFGDEFEASLPDGVKLTKIPSNTPTAAAKIEKANGIWRSALKRLLAAKKQPLTKWSEFTQEATEVVNTRPNSSIKVDQRWLSPKEVFDGSMKGDQELVTKVQEAIIAQANKRRGPGKFSVYTPGTTVRVADAAYLKADVKSNEMKMTPKWSTAVFKIKSIKANKKVVDGEEVKSSMLPLYTLRAVGPETQEVKLLLKPPKGESKRWHSHDMLQRVYGEPVETPDFTSKQPDMIARPFLQNPSIADKVEGPAASTRTKTKEQSTEQLRKLRVRKFQPNYKD